MSNPSRARTADLKLEVVVIPVSDVDRAKRFYDSLGWRLDADYISLLRLPPRAPPIRSRSASAVDKCGIPIAGFIGGSACGCRAIERRQLANESRSGGISMRKMLACGGGCHGSPARSALTGPRRRDGPRRRRRWTIGP